MAAATAQKEVFPEAEQGKEATTIFYERSFARQIRVLDSKINKLELQLNNELEKISSCSGLLDEIISQPLEGSPCAWLRAELDRLRAKRERAYDKFHRQQLGIMAELEIHDAPNPAAAAASN